MLEWCLREGQELWTAIILISTDTNCVKHHDGHSVPQWYRYWKCCLQFHGLIGVLRIYFCNAYYSKWLLWYIQYVYQFPPQDEGLEDVRQMIKDDHELVHRRLRGVLEDFKIACENYIRQSNSLGIGSGSGKTKLDKYRIKMCRNNIVSCKCHHHLVFCTMYQPNHLI